MNVQVSHECLEYCLNCWEFVNHCQCHSDDGRDYDLDPETIELPQDPTLGDEPVKTKKPKYRSSLP